MPFVFFEPSFHFVYLLLRQHTLVVEHSRIFLQVFKRGTLTRALAFRSDVLVDIVRARHIVKRSLARVFCDFVRACAFRQFIRCVLHVEYYGLIAYVSSPTHFLYPLRFVLVKIIRRIAHQALFVLFRVHVQGFVYAFQIVKYRREN